MKLTILFSVLTICLLAGCAMFTRSTQTNYGLLKAGMNTQEVTDLLGEPKLKSVTQPTETWTYQIYARDNTRSYPHDLLFENGKLTGWRASSKEAPEGKIRTPPPEIKHPSISDEEYKQRASDPRYDPTEGG